MIVISRAAVTLRCFKQIIYLQFCSHIQQQLFNNVRIKKIISKYTTNNFMQIISSFYSSFILYSILFFIFILFTHTTIKQCQMQKHNLSTYKYIQIFQVNRSISRESGTLHMQIYSFIHIYCTGFLLCTFYSGGPPL